VTQRLTGALSRKHVGVILTRDGHPYADLAARGLIGIPGVRQSS
jgi:hypothetical protein